MKKCLIIGGGLAGLTAASILSSKNYSVTVLESSPKLGGRAYSFKDPESNSDIDNGQHILMGCYRETLSFLKLTGAENNFSYQKYLELSFLSEERIIYRLKADRFFYPFNLLLAVTGYNALTPGEKISFISFVIKLPLISKRDLANQNAGNWLRLNHQSFNSTRMFWEILCAAALNTSLDKASALLFHTVLLEIFFTGNRSSTIILPKKGLTESIIEPAENFIKKNNGIIIKSETVKKFIIKNGLIVSVQSQNFSIDDYDYVISAVPLFSLQKISGYKDLGLKSELEYSAIVNVHIWSEDILINQNFMGFLNSPLHWIFRKDNHYNIVISDADYLVDKTNTEIYNFVIMELSKFINFDPADIKSFKVVKEKRATFVPSGSALKQRPGTITNVKNLFLAGDWLDTGLPATIESAVKSGSMAAESILKRDHGHE